MKRRSFEEFLAARADRDLRVIDVREQDEYEEVRLKGAELFALSKLKAGELPEEDEREVWIICRSGGRSQTACELLEDAGWPECTNIDGGTLAAIDTDESLVERG